jgi:manganese oxidase
VAYRLRLINIATGRPNLSVELRQDSLTSTWRTLAKDGADLPAAVRSARVARSPVATGETLDVEFFPAAPGQYYLDARTRSGSLLATLPIRVQ